MIRLTLTVDVWDDHMPRAISQVIDGLQTGRGWHLGFPMEKPTVVGQIYFRIERAESLP